MTAGTVRREEVDDHSSPLPSRLRDAAIALAVGHAPFASRLYGFDEYYLMAGRAGYIASLLDVAALAVLADALLRLARAAPSPVVRKGSQALFLVLALVALDRLRSQVLPIFHGRIALHWLYGWHLLAVKLFAIALVGAGVMVLLLRPRTRRLLVLAVEVALSLTVPFALWNVATLLGRIYADAQGVPPQSFAVAPQGSPTLASRRRIVLVIFDMFDYGRSPRAHDGARRGSRSPVARIAFTACLH